MAEIILAFIIAIPLYGVLIWSYFCPEESLMWGKRGMFKEEPEVSDGAIRYTKVASLISLIVLTLIFVISMISQF